MAGRRQDLYLAVTGDVTGLQNATKIGRSVLNEFGSTAIDVLAKVEAEFAKVGANDNIAAQVKATEKAYTESFRRIGDAARAAANAPTGQAAIEIIDANASRQAAEAATSKAAALRIVATAASAADKATGGTSASTRAFAIAAATAAVEADKEAEALREQAAVLTRVEGHLDRTGAAQKRVTAISGQTRAGFQQLSYQVGDMATQYSLGASASVIFASQSSQVIQAIQLISGESKGLLGILGGSWGIAFTAALSILAPFAGKLIAGSDALKEETDRLAENAAKAAIAGDAKAAFARTEAGVLDDVRALTDELKNQNDALKTNAERFNIRAKQDLEKLQGRRTERVEELDGAKAALTRAQGEQPGTSEASIQAYSQRINDAKAKVSEIERAIGQIDRRIADAQAARSQTQADLAVERARRSTDEAAEINHKYDAYDGLIEQARRRATAEERVNGVLEQQVRNLEKQRKSELDAAQKRANAGRAPAGPLTDFQSPVAGRVTGSFGERRPGHQHAGVDYAVPVGTPVRAPAAGTIDVAGQRQGYGNAIYINFGGGTTARFGHLSRFNVKPGDRVEAGDVIGYSGGAAGEPGSGRSTGPHLHYEVRRGGRAVDPRTGRFPTDAGGVGNAGTANAARSAEAEENRRIQNADAYSSLLSQVKGEQLRLERQRVTDIGRAAELDIAAVRQQQADLDRAAQKGVELDKWTQAEADGVKALTAQNAELQIQAIREREHSDLVNRRAELERDALDDRAGELRLMGELAGTLRERRDIARQLLKIERDQVEIALRARLATEKDPDRRAAIEGRIGGLDEEYRLKGRILERQNAGPTDQYRQRLRERVGDMKEALDGVRADGLQDFEDHLTRVIGRTESVSEAVDGMISSILASLARLAAQKFLLALLGGGGGGLDTDWLGSASRGTDAKVPSWLLMSAFADGGRIVGPGSGRSDSIVARVSNGEYIVNAAATRDHLPLLEAINRGGSLPMFADGGLVAPGALRWRALPDMRDVAPAAPVSAPIAISIDARGADSEGLKRVEAQLAQLQASLPGRIVSTVADARQRRIL